jgi:hypothetical protein
MGRAASAARAAHAQQRDGQDDTPDRAEEMVLKIKSEKDFWSGLMFLLVGAGFAAGALNYSFGSSARPGPAYFPFGLGVILAGLGLIVLFKSLTVPTRDGDRITTVRWRPLLIVLGAVALFGVMLPPLGMVISLPVLVVISALAGDEFHLGEACINAVALTIFSWLVFVKGLGLTIPVWPAFLAN